MTDNGELHVVFGTGPIGMSVMDELGWRGKRALGLFNPPMREMVEMLYDFEEPFIVDDSGFTRTFGEQATLLREAIQRTVRWYRQERPAGT